MLDKWRKGEKYVKAIWKCFFCEETVVNLHVFAGANSSALVFTAGLEETRSEDASKDRLFDYVSAFLMFVCSTPLIRLYFDVARDTKPARLSRSPGENSLLSR